MPQEYRNIYQISRESAGITQERAAELIDISVESIRAYEQDHRRPPDKVVVKMIEIYDARFLAYQHLKSAEVGQTFMLEIELRDLPTAILRLLKEINDLVNRKEDIISITCDGQISEDELPTWNAIMNEFDDVSAALLSVKFAKDKEG